MLQCPLCDDSRSVVPLVDAIRDDALLQPSEYGWLRLSSWGSLPARRSTFGGGWISRRVVGQVKRPRRGIAGVLQQGVGIVIGALFALVAIPAAIFGLVWLVSVSILLLPAVLIAWLIGVYALLRRAFTPGRRPSPYRRALVRLADFSYCPQCDAIFEAESGRVVPVERIHEVLYAGTGPENPAR